MSESLPKPIARYVRGFVARQRLHALLWALGVALALAVAWTLMATLLDRWLALAGEIRLGLLIIGGAGVAFILLRALWKLVWRRTDWVRVADEIERSNPHFGERLRTVISQRSEERRV